MTQDEKEKQESPATESSAYEIMRSRWAKMEAVVGGTETMRAAGQDYLPQHVEEDDTRYEERLGTATLINLTELTLESLVGRPFSDPVQLSEDMPEAVKEIMEDVDLQGNNIDVFGRRWFREGMKKAFAHVLVEFPKREEKADGSPRTLEDDRKERLRPYWVFIKPENLIFAFVEIQQGKEVVTHARFIEEVTEMVGFAEVVKRRIRVFEPGMQTIYEEREDDRKKVKWVMVESIPVDLPFVPLVTFYAAKDGPMLAKPPLMDLADLNIAHWQSGSDQRAILTVSRFPMLAMSGAADDERLVIGPFKWLYTSDPQGKFYYVEHTGKALKAGKDDLDDLIAQMSHYGGEFLKKQPGRQTATARALDSAEATSPLQDMTIRFMDAVDHALWITAQWLKLPEGGKVTLPTDFGPERSDQNDILALQFTRKVRDISRKWYLQELKRRGLLGDEFDADQDLEQIQNEMVLGISRVDLDETPTDTSTPGGPA
jgi:hypothetical protein